MTPHEYLTDGARRWLAVTDGAAKSCFERWKLYRRRRYATYLDCSIMPGRGDNWREELVSQMRYWRAERANAAAAVRLAEMACGNSEARSTDGSL